VLKSNIVSWDRAMHGDCYLYHSFILFHDKQELFIAAWLHRTHRHMVLKVAHRCSILPLPTCSSVRSHGTDHAFRTLILWNLHTASSDILGVYDRSGKYNQQLLTTMGALRPMTVASLAFILLHRRLWSVPSFAEGRL
jgi:hypothetical protein